jgi:hypothetical protein
MTLESTGPQPNELTVSHVDNNKTLKETRWREKMAEVDTIVDRLDLKVDDGIKEALAAVLIYEFQTNGSCEGHVADEDEEEHGLPYPWIQFYTPEPDGWEDAEGELKQQLDQAWTLEGLEQQQRLIPLLEEFYKDRETPFEARLIFDQMGFGGFRLQSFGAEMYQLYSRDERLAKLELYRQEMSDFARFLKEKYFTF